MDYANGQLGDWGIHWMDQILMWTEEKWPRRISSTGGRMIKQDSSDSPDTQIATFEFETFRAVWEHRQYAGNEAEKHNIGAYFYGTAGTFHMGWQDGWTFYPSKKGEPVVHEDSKLNGKDHENIRELWADFMEAIDKKRRPVCDIEVGHRSTNMSLLGVLSMKLGRSVRWNGETDTVVGDEEANGLLARTYRAPWVYPK
jgi:predicted dehydrogenase